EVEHRESYCHSRCGNDCEAVCSRCNTRSLTTTLSDSRPGDTEAAAIKWAVGAAQRQAQQTGRTGNIEIPVMRPGANGVYQPYIVIYNTHTRKPFMTRVFTKEVETIGMSLATGEQFKKIANLPCSENGQITFEQLKKVLEGEDGEKKQIIEAIPKSGLIFGDFRARIYDPKTGEQIVEGKLEVVDHQVHHTDDGSSVSVLHRVPPADAERLHPNEINDETISEASQQSESKATEGSNKEKNIDENIQKGNEEKENNDYQSNVRKENVEDTNIVGKIKKDINDSAKVNINELGTLIYPVEIFTDSERKELSEVLNDSLLVNFLSSGKIGQDSLNKNNYRNISLSSSSTPNNTQQTDKGKSTLIVFGVVFVLLVAEVLYRTSYFPYKKSINMPEQETEKEKPVVIQLDENQYKHFLIAFGNIVRELNSIAFKVKELENGMKLIEGELRLHSGYYFGSTSEVRGSCHHGCGHSHTEYEDLKAKYNKLNDEKLKNANEMANEKLSRQNTESTLRNEKKSVEEKLENFKTEKVGFLKQIEDGKQELSLIRVEKDNQLALIENKLTQKDDKLKELEKAMEALRVDKEKVIIRKDNSLQEASGELKRKEREIKELQKEGFQTREALLIGKLNSEKDNLEVFASELRINLAEVHNLTKNYQRLLFARKERNRKVVEESEEKIAQTKQTLLNSEVSVENIRKISRECENLATLRVSETATPEEIKNAYRKLALKWHPDKFVTKGLDEKKEANEKMQGINKAYEILSNDEKRRRYDSGLTDFPADDFNFQYDPKEEVRRQKEELRRREVHIADLELEILKLEMKALDRSSTLNEIGAVFCFTLPRVRAEDLDPIL
ncbi:38762_t:CDS:10, partial [Gigaspora margarita]